MPDGHEPVSARLVEGIGEIEAAQWDACAGEANPFVSHAFLLALEESGSATAEAGWMPRHLVIEDGGRLVACAPLYVKGHSQGEYVFDHGWADAYERAGGRYYPKFQVAVPFTPVTGPRLMAPPGAEEAGLRRALASALTELTRRFGLSSVHVTFPTEAEARLLEAEGWLLREDVQFHWENAGYESFDDFLAALSARKRKTIRRERRAVAEAGITVRPLTGDDLRPEHWDAFYRFYVGTYDRKWGRPYLTREFFARLHETMAERVLLVMAEEDGTPVAGALNLIGRDALYGRNWGALRPIPFLHFEACYYQAIAFAIARRLARVEAGTQGPHKLQRGYLPRPTWSAHWFADPALGRAVAEYLEGERRAVEGEIRALDSHSPFRREGDAPARRSGGEGSDGA